MKTTLLRTLPAIAAAALIAGCGGGHDAPAAPASAAPTQLSGVAAIGAPVAGGDVAVTCGSATGSAKTAADGTWTVSVTEPTYPCLAKVSGGSLPAGVEMYGYALSATNVNVTPLTTLIGAYATKAANGGTLTQALLDAAVTDVNELLATAGLPPLPADPLTVAFTPVAGDNYDDYLEAVMTALAAQDVTLAELVTQITTTGAPAAPIKAATIDFSDNEASVSVVQEGAVDVLQLETRQSAALASVKSFQTGVKSNRANFGTEVFHGMKLSEFPGVSFKAKYDGTSAGTPYLNYTISKQCDGTGWANLLTVVTNMNPSAPDADGYSTYTASITTANWKSTSSTTPLRAPDGTTVVLPPQSGSASTLQALIAAYPNACIYNWPNPDAQVPNETKTPAVMLMLGDSTNLRAKKAWFKDVRIGEVILF